MTEGDIKDALSKMVVGSTVEWRSTGLTERQIYALVRSGQLVRMRYGVYSTGEVLTRAETDSELRHAVDVAAVIAGRPGTGTGSFHSAALIRGLTLLNEPDPPVVTLTVPPTGRDRKYRRNGSYRSKTGVVTHIADLPAKHVTKRFGVPITTAARTVVDISRTCGYLDGVVIADSALHERYASKTEMRRVLESCAGWPGIEEARKAVEFASPLAESPFESCARVRFSELGLEPPELQGHILNKKGVVIARTDFCWRHHHTVAEADGGIKYDEQEDLDKQFARDRRLQAAGWQTVHFTWTELSMDAGSVVAAIRAAFHRAALQRR